MLGKYHRDIQTFQSVAARTANLSSPIFARQLYVFALPPPPPLSLVAKFKVSLVRIAGRASSSRRVRGREGEREREERRGHRSATVQRTCV